jgi:flagellar biosynthetic protein FlhB
MPVVAGGGFLLNVALLLLGRALPQLPVFQDSFLFRAVIGLFLFGGSLHLAALHLGGRSQRLPGDLLDAAALLEIASGPIGEPMADDPESKTEQATPKRLQESLSKGQFARSAEINTLFSILTTLVILKWIGPDLWRALTLQFQGLLGSLRPDLPTAESSREWSLFQRPETVGIHPPTRWGWPSVSGILASGVQSRFHFTPGALALSRWGRLNPLDGFQQLFKPGMLVDRGQMLNLALILWVASTSVWDLVNHPVFLTDSSLEELLRFMGEAVEKLLGRLLFGLALIVAGDYGYQVWKTSRELKMSKQEVKEESRSSEGDPESKARMKKVMRKMRLSWMKTVPTADVVVTNPTAPVRGPQVRRQRRQGTACGGQGAGLQCAADPRIARNHQVPLVKNKPVARLLFQICEEGDAIDPRVYAGRRRDPRLRLSDQPLPLLPRQEHRRRMAKPLPSAGLMMRMPKSQLAVAFFVLGSLLLLIQPIPAFLLDALIVVSLGSAVLTLMVVLFFRDPAELSRPSPPCSSSPPCSDWV